VSYADDTELILDAWRHWYSEHVEPIADYALGATELLINRDRYPHGKRTMPVELTERVRFGVQQFEGSLAWGGDRVRPDEALYEIARPPGDHLLTLFADRLRAGQAVGAPEEEPDA